MASRSDQDNAAAEAMKEELGLGRLKDLPMEDGKRSGAGRLVSGPVINLNQPAPRGAWYDAINDGEFDDDDAEAVKGLDDIANGRLHAIRDQSHGNGGGGHLTLAQVHRPKKRPSPFDPNHDLQQPVHGFGFGPLSSQNPAAEVTKLAIGKGKKTKQKQPANQIASKMGQGSQQDLTVHVDKKRRAASVASADKPVPSMPRQPIITNYRLPTRPPPGLISPAAPNQQVDISKRLPGVEILYMCKAQLQEPAPLEPVEALVSWCRPPQANEPMLVVLVQMDIRHQYPASRWKHEWNGGPETIFIKLRDDYGTEITVGLIFAAHPAADAFLHSSRKIIKSAMIQPQASQETLLGVNEKAAKGSVAPPTIQVTSASSDECSEAPMSISAQPKTHNAGTLQPKATVSAVGPRNGHLHPKDLPSGPSKKTATSVAATGVITTSRGSKFSPPPKEPAKGPTATAQDSQLKVEVSKAESLALIQLDAFAAPAVSRAKVNSYMDDLFGLSISAQNCSVADSSRDLSQVQQGFDSWGQDADQTEMDASRAGSTVDGVFAQCKTIISAASYVINLGPLDHASANESLRQRLLDEICQSFRGINQTQKGRTVSMLLRLFDTILRPDGLQYSTEELEKLRSDAALPSGWVCHNVRADVSLQAGKRDDKEAAQDPVDLRKQLGRVVFKQPELAQVQAKAMAHPPALDSPWPAKDMKLSRWSSIVPEGSALRDLAMLIPSTDNASMASQPTTTLPQRSDMDTLDSVFKGLSITAVPSRLNPGRAAAVQGLVAGLDDINGRRGKESINDGAAMV